MPVYKHSKRWEESNQPLALIDLYIDNPVHQLRSYVYLLQQALNNAYFKRILLHI